METIAYASSLNVSTDELFSQTTKIGVDPIDFIHNETVEGAFVSGIISSVGCYCLPPSDYGLGCNAINAFEKQARNIEIKYSRISELIRTAGFFFQRDADTQRDESKILRRLGKPY